MVIIMGEIAMIFKKREGLRNVTTQINIRQTNTDFNEITEEIFISKCFHGHIVHMKCIVNLVIDDNTTLKYSDLN